MPDDVYSPTKPKSNVSAALFAPKKTIGLSTLNDDVETVLPPPPRVIVPVIATLPPMFKLPTRPIPPLTVKAPVVVFADCVSISM